MVILLKLDPNHLAENRISFTLLRKVTFFFTLKVAMAWLN